MQTYLFLGVVLVQSLGAAQTSIEYPACVQLTESALRSAAANRLDQAEGAISTAVSQGESFCAGVVAGYLSTLAEVQGRYRDSEALAVRSVDLLKTTVSSDDPALLGPLHMLAMARLEQGKFGQARQAYEQMLEVRPESPQERGQIHLTGGVLRQVQGDLKGAESEYLLAYEEWTRLGKTADADAASIFNYLGTVYLSEMRLKEASEMLDRALGIIAVAENAFPVDRINLLNTRAWVHARQGEWPQAQEKLRLAIAIAKEVGVSEPVLLRSVLNNYAIALRKNHHRREARAIESRASALPLDPAASAVIDVHDLSPRLRAGQH